jgi:hypothetical protein
MRGRSVSPSNSRSFDRKHAGGARRLPRPDQATVSVKRPKRTSLVDIYKRCGCMWHVACRRLQAKRSAARVLKCAAQAPPASKPRRQAPATPGERFVFSGQDVRADRSPTLAVGTRAGRRRAVESCWPPDLGGSPVMRAWACRLPEPGERVGQYRVVGPLGQGGQGHVFHQTPLLIFAHAARGVEHRPHFRVDAFLSQRVCPV